MPDELGKYNSFLLGNAFFVHSSRIYVGFLFILQLRTPLCVYVEILGYASVFKHRLWGDTRGARRAPPSFRPGTCPFAKLPQSGWGAPMCFYPGKPSQDDDFYSKQ